MTGAKGKHYTILILLVVSGILFWLGSPATCHDEAEKSYQSSQFKSGTYNKNMNVTCFASPDGSTDTLWHFLSHAQESIYVEIYGISNPYILDLIHEIHAANPSIDMKFLLGWDSLGYTSANDYVANNLTLLGCPVRWTSDSEFNFAHQKFVIIDNKTTIVHTGNWAITSFPDIGSKANREWSIAMTDVEVTQCYRDIFDYDWSNGEDYDAGIHGTGSPLSYSSSSSTYPRPFAAPGQFSGPMNVTPIYCPIYGLEGILYCIYSAQVTLDIQIPYFANVGEGDEVDMIIDAILAAKARGVTIRIISEEEKDFLEVAAIFKNHSIPIVWQDSRWTTANHNKGIIVDGRIVLITSSNFADNDLWYNREVGVIIENEDVAQWYLEIFDYDWGMADFSEIGDVNIYWEPNIPTSSDSINVTVFGHELFGDGITSVNLSVKIGEGPQNYYDISANVFESAEGNLENYYYVIPAQSDTTNITLGVYVVAGGFGYASDPMVVHVRDSIPAVQPPPTATTTTTTTPIVVTTPDYEEIISKVVPIVAGIGAVIISGYIAKRTIDIADNFRELLGLERKGSTSTTSDQSTTDAVPEQTQPPEDTPSESPPEEPPPQEILRVSRNILDPTITQMEQILLMELSSLGAPIASALSMYVGYCIKQRSREIEEKIADGRLPENTVKKRILEVPSKVLDRLKGRTWENIKKDARAYVDRLDKSPVIKKIKDTDNKLCEFVWNTLRLEELEKMSEETAAAG